MEIDVTRFFNDADPYDFSASMAERGNNAGPETWANAVREGTDAPLLTTEDELAALRDYAKRFGAWSEDEVAAWSDAECNALFIQFISGDMREIEALCMKDDGEVDWDQYEAMASEGQISSNLFQGIDGHIYYYLGH